MEREVSKKDMHKRFAYMMCVHCIIGAAFVFGIAALVMLLWNCLVPTIIGWQAVTYWQAFGLLVLANLIFFPHYGHHCGHHHHGHHSHCGYGDPRKEAKEA